MLKILQIRQFQCTEFRERRQVLQCVVGISMSADNLDLSRVQRPVWDTERRYRETRNPDCPRFSLLINRMGFTPQKHPH